jgi:hypothetical protein
LRRVPELTAAPRRPRYVALALATIVAGLVVHLALRGVLPDAVRDVAGDALWATMVAWWIGALAPARSAGVRAAVAYTVCVAVECSQLLHTPTLDALRATTPGHLVLGSGFDPRDLVAYLVGVLAAWRLEFAVAGAGGGATRRGTAR